MMKISPRVSPSSLTLKSLTSVGLAAGLLLTGFTASSPATAQSNLNPTLTALRENLIDYGNLDDVAKFDHLSASQLVELTSLIDSAEWLQVPKDAAKTVTSEAVSYRDGDAEWSETSPTASLPATGVASKMAAAAVTGTRSVWGAQSFWFAGIKLTETRIDMRFSYNGNTATSIGAYSCSVMQNYIPVQSVSSSKSSSYVVSGSATAKCKVVVNRLGLGESVGYQRLTATGNGTLTYNGWS